MADDQPYYRHRGGFVDDETVLKIVHHLRELEQKTQPSSGSHPDKDFDSRLALTLAGNLVDMLVGWAIDHQAGLAINGVASAPVPPQGHSQEFSGDSFYKKAAEEASDHRHEADGGSYLTSCNNDPVSNRRVVAALIHNFSLHAKYVLINASIALNALEFGEVQPILKPVKSGRKGAPFSLDRMKLRAIQHIEFRMKRYGATKTSATEIVANAYGCNTDAVKKWEALLRKNMGNSVVDAIYRASCAARNSFMIRSLSNEVKIDYTEVFFSDNALKEDGAKYQEIIREASGKT